MLSALIASVALAVALRAKEVAESANKIANQGNDLAQTANGVAEAGNALAQSANETAANALGEAEKANEIASASNRLAGDANEIAERALRVAQDDVPYKWVLCVGDDGNAVVTNDCGHHALQVTVALESGGRVIAEHAVEDFDPFGKITLDVWGVLGQHFETVRSHPVVHAHREGGLVFAGRNGEPVCITFRAHMRWRTEQDIPRTSVVKEVLCHQMTHDGLKRVTDD
ncbi:hypothetical protein C1S80_11350 [Mycolicibacterium aubagnense]|nr:hypothetical protein C1S80_11350 [Mycolicibacterium aubagnense]